VIEKYDAIDDISYEQLMLFSKQLKKRLYCRMLIQGNMLKTQALKVMDIVTQTLKFKPLISNTWPQVSNAIYNYNFYSYYPFKFILCIKNPSNTFVQNL